MTLHNEFFRHKPLYAVNICNKTRIRRSVFAATDHVSVVSRSRVPKLKKKKNTHTILNKCLFERPVRVFMRYAIAKVYGIPRCAPVCVTVVAAVVNWPSFKCGDAGDWYATYRNRQSTPDRNKKNTNRKNPTCNPHACDPHNSDRTMTRSMRVTQRDRARS